MLKGIGSDFMPDFLAGHIADQATSRAKKSGIISLPKPFELGNRREQFILACNQLKFGSYMSRAQRSDDTCQYWMMIQCDGYLNIDLNIKTLYWLCQALKAMVCKKRIRDHHAVEGTLELLSNTEEH